MSSLLAGIAYIVIGRFFPNPSADARWWRLGAWALSALVVILQVVYEHRKGRLPARAARAVAMGAAIGGFGLAFWAMTAAGVVDRKWVIALVAWPLFLAIPTFVVAYVGAILLQRIDRGASPP